MDADHVPPRHRAAVLPDLELRLSAATDDVASVKFLVHSDDVLLDVDDVLLDTGDVLLDNGHISENFLTDS